jgi:hypothetical protein
MSNDRFTKLNGLPFSLEDCLDLDEEKELPSMSYQQRIEQLDEIYAKNQDGVDPMLTTKLEYPWEPPEEMQHGTRARMDAEECEDEEMKEAEEDEEWTGWE